MKQFTYTIEHSVGNASGSIEAKSKKAARDYLTKQYTTEHLDGDGKTQTVKIKELVLTEVETDGE